MKERAANDWIHTILLVKIPPNAGSPFRPRPRPRARRRSSDREWIATRARAMTTAEDDVDEDALLYGDVGAWATTRGAFAGWNAAISTVFVR